MVCVMVLLLIVHALVQYFQTYLLGWVGQSAIRDLRHQLYNHLLGMKVNFYDRTPIGTLVTRTISDIETLADVFSDGLASVSGDILQLVFILAVMFFTDVKLTLISLSVFPILLYASYLFKNYVRASFQEVRKQVARLNAFIQEQITGMSIVQVFNREEKEFAKFKVINAEHTKANIDTIFYYSVYFPVVEIIAAVSTGLLVWYGTKGVLHDTVSLGVLISFLMYIAMFFRPIRQIADRFNTLQLGMVSSERVFRLLDTKDTVKGKNNYIPSHINGKIVFRNVYFNYKKEEDVLYNISFEIEPNKTTAIVGATGAGKSTLINIILRFYEPEKGNILLDDIPLEDYQPEFLRKNIGTVTQDVFLFSGTIRDNIALWDTTITDSVILNAIRKIGVDDFINNLPGGLDCLVMERGAMLSTGQRQLIAFIRAMVRNPNLILLDEATSSVDSETENMIQHAIKNILANRTSVVIAHRLSTIIHSDKIIVMDMGKIVETGTHAQLLAMNGIYHELYTMQYIV